MDNRARLMAALDGLHQLLITVSRLDMGKLHPVAGFAELLKFFGLLIVVSISLMAGFIYVWWEERKQGKRE